VRLTAQSIIATNLRPVSGISKTGSWGEPKDRNHRYWVNNHAKRNDLWVNIDLDLAGATLVDFNFMDCRVQHANFKGAQFFGDTWFSFAEFREDANFDGASFRGSQTRFRRAVFERRASFRYSVFFGDTSFEHADLDGDPWGEDFSGTQFLDIAGFQYARLGGRFQSSLFKAEADFEGVRFSSSADFHNVRFCGRTDFRGGRFNGRTWMQGGTIVGPRSNHIALPPGWVASEAETTRNPSRGASSRRINTITYILKESEDGL
jgi:hypothetical protein